MNIKTQSPSGNESIVLIHWICKETFKYLPFRDLTSRYLTSPPSLLNPVNGEARKITGAELCYDLNSPPFFFS